MKLKRIIPALSILVFLSCVSAPPAAQVDSSTAETEIQEEKIPEVFSMRDLPDWVYDSTPVDGKPRIVVISGRKADRDDELEAAAQLAALEAAKIQGLYVSAKELSQKGNTNFGYASDVYIDYNKNSAPGFLDRLNLDKQIRTPDGTIARFIVDGIPIPLELEITGSNPPDWVNSVPEVPGYLLTVGVTERHRNWKESFRAADESALAQAAYTLFGKVDNQVERQEQATNSTSRMDQLGTIYIRGEGTVRNLLILGRWTDSEEKLFYSMIAVPWG